MRYSDQNLQSEKRISGLRMKERQQCWDDDSMKRENAGNDTERNSLEKTIQIRHGSMSFIKRVVYR